MDTVNITVNGKMTRHRVDARTLLVHYLRNVLGLTGTHVGCDSSQCGACTVLLDGWPVRSCSILAVQADDCSVETVEGLAPDGETLHPIQQAFHEEHGLQCGFCTPGVVMTVVALLRENANPSEAEIRRALSGNLCRCTGYHTIVRSVLRAASDTGSQA